MSKLRKVCAILCSGMCALGSASADPSDRSMKDLQDMISRNPAAFKSSVQQVVNDRIAKYGQEREASSYAPYSPVLFGFSFGKNAASAEAIGRLKVLKDQEILKYINEGDLDYLKKVASNKKAGWISVYVLLRCIFAPCVGGGVWFGVIIFLSKCVSNWLKLGESGAFAVACWIISILVSYIASSSAAGGFNVLAQKLKGESKEVKEICEEMWNIASRAAQQMKNASRKRSNSAPVKRSNKLKVSKKKTELNQKQVVESGPDKVESTKEKVSSMKVASERLNKMGNLNSFV